MDKIWHRGTCYQISAEKLLAPKNIHAYMVAT